MDIFSKKSCLWFNLCMYKHYGVFFSLLTSCESNGDVSSKEFYSGSKISHEAYRLLVSVMTHAMNELSPCDVNVHTVNTAHLMRRFIHMLNLSCPHQMIGFRYYALFVNWAIYQACIFEHLCLLMDRVSKMMAKHSCCHINNISLCPLSKESPHMHYNVREFLR